MTCEDCAARTRLLQDALFRAAVGEAMAHAAKGAAELVGLKEKTGLKEEREKQDAENFQR